MKHIEANNQHDENSCKKLAASVIHQAIMDFVREKGLEAYHFLTGKTSATMWFEHAQIEPLDGDMDTMHETILNNLATTKTNNTIYGEKKKLGISFDEAMARARFTYYKKDPALLAYLRKKRTSTRKELTILGYDPKVKLSKTQAIEAAPVVIKKFNQIATLEKEIKQISLIQKDVHRTQQCA